MDIETLERMVTRYCCGTLPEDVTVHIYKQSRDAYGALRWDGYEPQPFLEDGESLAGVIVSEPIELTTVAAPPGNMRAGYGPDSKVLVLVDVTDDDTILDPRSVSDQHTDI